MQFFSGNSLWHLVTQSDAMTKFVLLVLLGLSVICWTIFFYKFLSLKQKTKHLQDIKAKVLRAHSYEQLKYMLQTYAHSPEGVILLEQLHETTLLESGILPEREKTFIDQQRWTAIDEYVHQENEYLSVLSVTAAVSPLIGLFGTVWGLMHSFMSISQRQTADIVTTAPGIAEALITTLAGLMVAIPMLALYHYLQSQLSAVEFELNQLSDRCLLLTQKYTSLKKDSYEQPFNASQTSHSTIPS